MGQTAETHQSAYTFAHMAVQTQDEWGFLGLTNEEGPEELKKTIVT